MLVVRRLQGWRSSVAAAKATSSSIKMFTKTTGDFRVANMAREGPMAKKPAFRANMAPCGQCGQEGPPCLRPCKLF